ncbi:FKBP-type peptidyl-prolyl cis-trans isomerase [Zestomonas thermotolerans]|uniref:FKBP-type peptidyl-prolyl cis-trans isomerase n=1 Tax=Zestomonas thermotolerans TaxID=157784 RepID=UPI00035FB13F|nr:FKBP-type peptidyl-prolyl cis-trans isomerase [Pseudomonas thermotolerans]MBO2509190.1 FKBP-type peptidyl-prolyl cis-trans isomerase [Gammaproteobacteria bacterium]
MPRFLPLYLLLAATPLLAVEPGDDLAYALGARLGERLRGEVPGLNVEELLTGLRQAYRGETLRLDARHIDHLLAEHEVHQQDAEVERAMARERRFLANEKARPGVRELAGGVLRSELRAGLGARPKADGRVRVRYAGWLADGSLFDESQTPQWFKLDSVIAGWRTALLEMPTGAKWRLVIPSAQAYGAQGAGDLIPPHTPLVFEVELLEVAD